MSYLSLFPIVLCFVDVPGKAKVGYFDDAVLCQQDVSGGQIAVQQFSRGQVLHAPGHLVAPLQQVPSGERCAARATAAPAPAQRVETRRVVVWRESERERREETWSEARLHRGSLLAL